MEDTGTNDLIRILSQISIFYGLGDGDLMKIVPLLNPVTYPPENLILKEGTMGDSMYIIKKGAVNVAKTENNKDYVNLGNLYAGSYFGELSLIDNLPRSADVKTIEETEIFILDKKNFDRLLNMDMRIANIFYKNCLNETFSRFRNMVSNFTFSQHILREKSEILVEINKDLSAAQKIQKYFITESQADENIFSGFARFTYIYRPTIAVGGDFFTVEKAGEGRVAMIIADFEGHGITAALGTGVLKSIFALAVKQMGGEPARLMAFLNRHFNKVIRHLYATCYYALFDPPSRKVTLVKAGHHHPLFWKKKYNDFVQVDGAGIGLGIVPDGKFHQVEYEIEEGDRLLFFTDGIIEQFNENNEMYSLRRLTFNFQELIKCGEKEVLNKLFQDLKEFSRGTSFDDDITLLLFEF